MPTDHEPTDPSLFDVRDLRELAGHEERRGPRPGRRLGDGTAVVDSILFGRVCAAHTKAEEIYLREGALGTHPARVGALNGKAEGLAEAVAILSGVEVVEVRAGAAARWSEKRARGREGAEGAREALRRSRAPIPAS